MGIFLIAPRLFYPKYFLFSIRCVFFTRSESLYKSRYRLYFLVQQLAVIPPKNYNRKIGNITAAQLIKNHLIALCYNSHDMKDFALACGAEPNAEPIIWNSDQRRHLMARLDALYFILYDIADEQVEYILESFPITQKRETELYGNYQLKSLILAYIKALRAGDSVSVMQV